MTRYFGLLTVLPSSGFSLLLHHDVLRIPKDDWANQCASVSGLVSPYYVPPDGEATTVVCVPGLCQTDHLGRSTDHTIGSAAPCTWNKLEDACCTDKVKNVPCGGGTVPCVLGHATTLEEYTTRGVAEAKKADLEAVKEDCKGKEGPVARFEKAVGEGSEGPSNKFV